MRFTFWKDGKKVEEETFEDEPIPEAMDARASMEERLAQKEKMHKPIYRF